MIASRIALLCAAAFISLASASIAQEKLGSITGSVVDRATKLPLPGVNVLLDGLGKGASTDAGGRYEIRNVAVGTYRVKCTFIGYKTSITSDVVVKTGHSTVLDVELSEEAIALGQEVVVTASYFQTPGVELTSAYGMNYEEIRRQPGAVGDVSRMIQTMPGVVPTNDQRNDLVVRGGSPSENLTIVDNIEVPNISHFGTQGASGGPITMLTTEFIREADFMAGGFSARYGDRLSSVLNISLREGNRDGLAGTFDLSMAGAGFIVEGPMGASGSWMVSARKSYLDLIFKNFGVGSIPYYSNYQAKAVYEFGPSHKISLVSLGGMDDVHFEPDDDEKGDPEAEESKSGGWRTTTGINWRWLWGNVGYGTLTVSDTWNSYEQDVFYPYREGKPKIFFNSSGEGESIAAYNATIAAGSFGDISAGAGYRYLRSSYEITAPDGSHSGYSSDTAKIYRPPLIDDITAYRTDCHIQTLLKPLPRTEVTLGARVDYYSFIDKAAVSPRAALRYAVTENIDFSMSWGMFYQQPALVYLNAYPQNALLDPMKAEHLVAGIAWYPRPDLKLSVEAFRKVYTQYPVSVEFPQYSLSNSGTSYTVKGNMMPLVSLGKGHAEGVELFIQQKLSDALYGQVSYSFSHSYYTAIDGIERKGAFDIPHVLYIIGGYRFNEEWEFSSKFSYASGRPRTPALLPESAEQDRFILDLSRLNEARVSDYHRLDIRLDHRNNFSGWNLVVFLELQNAYNHKNVFAYKWDGDTQSEEAVYQTDTFVVGGIKIEF